MVKLGEITQLHYGKGLPERIRIPGEFPVYSSSGHTGIHNEALAENGVVIGRKGSVGTIYWVEGPFFCIDTAYFVKPNYQIYHLKWLYYALQTLGLNELNEDSAVPGLNRETAYKQILVLPPLPEQEAIAEVLSSLDDKIDLLHRQNRTLEEMAGVVISNFCKELPEVPLGNICKVSSSKRVFYEEYREEGIPFYRGKEVTELSKTGRAAPEIFISSEMFNEIKRIAGAPGYGDILITAVGTLGNIYRVGQNEEFYFKDGNIIWLQDLDEDYSQLLSTWLKLSEGQEKLLSGTIGSTQQALTIASLKEVLVPDFNLTSRNQVKIVKAITSKAGYNIAQIRTLTQTRDLLLPRLLRGEVVVL